MTKEIYAQGDILIEKVHDSRLFPETSINVDPDGAIVLARGEVTGHRHAFYGDNVVMFRDDSLARDIPSDLYIGSIKVNAPATLKHEEHLPITLPPGEYRIRRQREFAEEMNAVVAD